MLFLSSALTFFVDIFLEVWRVAFMIHISSSASAESVGVGENISHENHTFQGGESLVIIHEGHSFQGGLVVSRDHPGA